MLLLSFFPHISGSVAVYLPDSCWQSPLEDAFSLESSWKFVIYVLQMLIVSAKYNDMVLLPALPNSNPLRFIVWRIK